MVSLLPLSRALRLRSVGCGMSTRSKGSSIRTASPAGVRRDESSPLLMHFARRQREQKTGEPAEVRTGSKRIWNLPACEEGRIPRQPLGQNLNSKAACDWIKAVDSKCRKIRMNAQSTCPSAGITIRCSSIRCHPILTASTARHSSMSSRWQFQRSCLT